MPVLRASTATVSAGTSRHRTTRPTSRATSRGATTSSSSSAASTRCGRRPSAAWSSSACCPVPSSAGQEDASAAACRRSTTGSPCPSRSAREIFDIATSIVKIPCVCRTFAGHEPRGGLRARDHAADRPLLEEGFKDYDDGPDVSSFERLTQGGGAGAAAPHARTRGLMHSVWTFMTPFIGAICNCNLDSGCMAMKLTVGYSMPMMWRGESVMQLDTETCTSCKQCVGLCPFGAFWRASNGTGQGACRLRRAKCWGCGICRSACKSGALVACRPPSGAGSRERLVAASVSRAYRRSHSAVRQVSLGAR